MDSVRVVLRTKQSYFLNSNTFHFIHGKDSNCKTLSLVLRSMGLKTCLIGLMRKLSL